MLKWLGSTVGSLHVVRFFVSIDTWFWLFWIARTYGTVCPPCSDVIRISFWVGFGFIALSLIIIEKKRSRLLGLQRLGWVSNDAEECLGRETIASSIFPLLEETVLKHWVFCFVECELGCFLLGFIFLFQELSTILSIVDGRYIEQNGWEKAWQGSVHSKKPSFLLLSRNMIVIDDCTDQ